MALINANFFIGDIYLPEAKPSLKDNPNESEFMDIINAAEFECLEKALGSILALELYEQVNLSNENKLITGVDQKWEDLFYGKKYTNRDGEDVVFKGLFYKNNPLAENENTSLIAYYAYWYHERIDSVTRSKVGHTLETSKNAEIVTPKQKVSFAWNKFVKMTVGEKNNNVFFITNEYVNGYGLDFYSSKSRNVSLYDFIIDSNYLSEEGDVYENFTPCKFHLDNNII